MNIRLANMMDLPSLMDLFNRVFPALNAIGNFRWDNEYPINQTFSKDINDHNLFIAREDGKILGVVAIDSYFPSEYSSVDWKSSPNSFTFHRMMVDPDHRGVGVAQALFKYLEYRGKLLGLKAIRVDAHHHNLVMLHLFKKLNYSHAGVVKFRGLDSDFICFEKTLL